MKSGDSMRLSGYDSMIPLPNSLSDFQVVPCGVDFFDFNGKPYFSHRIMEFSVSTVNWKILEESNQFPSELFADSEFDRETCQKIALKLKQTPLGQKFSIVRENLIQLFTFSHVVVITRDFE